MSEAERLADLMGAAPKGPGFIEYSPVTIHKAAAELRRLSAELAALKAAIGEPAAWVDERVIQWLASRPSSASTNITTKLAAAKCPERPMPLYTHPAPQAKPQPLSDERLEDIALDVMGFAVLDKAQNEVAMELMRKVEAAHGITKE